MGDVRDLDVSPDGKKLVFSLRLPLEPQQAQHGCRASPPGRSTSTTPVREDRDAADQRQHHRRPRCGRALPAGRPHRVRLDPAARDPGHPARRGPSAVPGANRRSQAVDLSAARHECATARDMHQISFNTNHDFAPSVLANGQIVFSRWESDQRRPDQPVSRQSRTARGLELFYGANSHATGANIAGTNNNVIQFLNARQRADGKLVAIVRPFLGHAAGRRHRADRCRKASSRSISRLTPGAAAPARRRPAPPRWASPPMRTCLPSGGRFASAYPAVRRHQPNAGELGALPGARYHRDAEHHQSLHRRRTPAGANVTAGAAAVHPLDLRLRTRAP